MIVLLTGAGASVPFGYPTTTQFFDGFTPSGRRKETFNYLRNFLRGEVFDVEIALEILDASREFMDSRAGQFLAQRFEPNWRDDVLDLCAALKSRCFEKYGADCGLDAVETVMGPLLEACAWRTQLVSLYTTNYDPIPDRVLEVAAKRGVRSYDGFQHPVSRWDASGYEAIDEGLRLYRLHGSMSWVRGADGRVTNTRDYSAREGGGNHLLIYPGYKGNPQLEETPMSEAHTALRDDIMRCTTMVSVGFAHRDPHLQSILDECCSARPDLRLIVLNPQLPAQLPDCVVEHIAAPLGDPSAITRLAAALA